MPRPRIIEPLEPRTLLSVQLVADLNTTPASSNPSDTIQANGLNFFIADDNVHGREVWRTDGTAEGTRLVADFAPGPQSSDSQLLGTAGNLAFIRVGSSIWQTDGTPQNTTQANNVVFSTVGYFPSAATSAAIGNDFYFTSSSRGLLYRIRSGIISEIKPSQTVSWFTRVVSNGSRLFMVDDRNVLWTSDGTTAGTYPLQFGSGVASDELVRIGDTVYLARTGSELWKTQGTDATTARVAKLPATPVSITASGSTLYFWAGRSPTDLRTGALWKSDGTPEGTALIKYVPLNRAQLTPPLPALVASGGKVFFGDTNPGLSPPQASKLWVSDGTPEGTVNIGATVFPLSGGSPYNTEVMRDFNGVVLFQGRDTAAGVELWRTDGTEAGTSRVADFVPGVDGSSPQILAVIGSRAVIAATTPDVGHELWTTDGTPAGTAFLKDLNTGTAGSIPTTPVAVNGKLLFTVAGRLQVQTDPTGTPHELTFPDPAVRASSVTNLTPGATLAYFTASVTGFPGQQLCTTDGTPEGTRVVKSMSGLGTSNFTAVGDRLFFTGGNFANESLFTSDGTADGTLALAGGFYFFNTTERPHPNFGAAGDRFYFSAQIGTTGPKELWVSDGTPAGTTRVASFSASVYLSTQITAANGRVYFKGGDLKLYQTDGTPAGTSRFNDGNGNLYGATPAGALLFSDVDGNLMRLGPGDAAPVRLVGSYALPTRSPVVMGDALYYFSGSNLWRTDGTPAGTRRVLTGLSPANLTVAANLLYYTDTPSVGYELYATDGTTDAPYLVADMIPGRGSPDPQYLTAVGDTLYFSALDGVHGRELWRAVNGDDLAPFAVRSSFSVDFRPQQVTVTFAENVSDSLALGDWKLIDRATGQDLSYLLTSQAYGIDSNVVILKLAAAMPSANYRLTLPAGAAEDHAGNPTTADISLDFYLLAGDINRDRVVNFNDLLILAKNYNKTLLNYTSGDLTGDGVVNFDDLLILAKNYNATLPDPDAVATPPSPAPAPESAFALLAPAAAPVAPVKPTATRPKPAPVFNTSPIPPKRPPAPPKPAVRKAR